MVVESARRTSGAAPPALERYRGLVVVLEIRQGYPADMGERYDAIARAYPESEWETYHALPRERDPDHVQAHCDDRILHEPGECPACDLYPTAQLRRVKELVAFTGKQPLKGETPCPADLARPGVHQKWPGNRPAGYGVWPHAGSGTGATSVVPPADAEPAPAPRRRRLRVRWPWR